MQAKKLEATGTLETRVLEILAGAPGGGHMHRAEVVEALGLSASHQEVALALGNLVNARAVERIGATFRIKPKAVQTVPVVVESTQAFDPAGDDTDTTVLTIAMESGSAPYKYIEAIRDRGGHGNSLENVLQQLVWEGIRRLVDEGWIDRMEATGG